MRVIYDGVKADAAPEDYRRDMEWCMESLTKKGADYFILGCTELPVAAQLLDLPQATVDPTAELAKAAILFCGYELK